jgi:hypothetical protein
MNELNTLRRKVRLDSSASPYGPLTEYVGHGKEWWGLVNSLEYHDRLRLAFSREVLVCTQVTELLYDGELEIKVNWLFRGDARH